MLPCDKQQKNVKRTRNLTFYRCMNKRCGVFGQEVDERVCSSCPVRVLAHKRPCAKRTPFVSPVVTTKEILDVSDATTMEMIKDAGMDVKDFNQEDSEIPPNYPPVSMQLWTYKEALIKWNKAGRPTRTKEEVERIHRDICSPCEWYDKEKQRCKGCGCKVTVGSIAVFNKLKMATEKCPKGLF